jgi:hypothetical protein
MCMLSTNVWRTLVAINPTYAQLFAGVGHCGALRGASSLVFRDAREAVDSMRATWLSRWLAIGCGLLAAPIAHFLCA